MSKQREQLARALPIAADIEARVRAMAVQYGPEPTLLAVQLVLAQIWQSAGSDRATFLESLTGTWEVVAHMQVKERGQ